MSLSHSNATFTVPLVCDTIQTSQSNIDIYSDTVVVHGTLDISSHIKNTSGLYITGDPFICLNSNALVLSQSNAIFSVPVVAGSVKTSNIVSESNLDVYISSTKVITIGTTSNLSSELIVPFEFNINIDSNIASSWNSNGLTVTKKITVPSICASSNTLDISVDSNVIGIWSEGGLKVSDTIMVPILVITADGISYSNIESIPGGGDVQTSNIVIGTCNIVYSGGNTFDSIITKEVASSTTIGMTIKSNTIGTWSSGGLELSKTMAAPMILISDEGFSAIGSGGGGEEIIYSNNSNFESITTKEVASDTTIDITIESNTVGTWNSNGLSVYNFLSTGGIFISNESKLKTVTSIGTAGIGAGDTLALTQSLYIGNGPENFETPVYIDRMTTQSNSIYSIGDVTARGYNYHSDSRIKTNVSALDTAASLAMINNIRPCEFNYTIGGPERKAGFIAQEIEKIIPSAVNSISEYIPNIMEDGNVHRIDTTEKTLHIHLHVNYFIESVARVGDNVRLVYNKTFYNGVIKASSKNMLTVTIDGVNVFQIGSKITVLGTKVDDFKTIQYEQILSHLVSAVQDLSKQLSSRSIAPK